MHRATEIKQTVESKHQPTLENCSITFTYNKQRKTLGKDSSLGVSHEAMPRATSRGRCGVAEAVTSRFGGVALPLYPGLCGACGPVRKRIAYSFAGSSGHQGRLRRNREESTAGDMWRPVRTPPPHALVPDSALRIPALGSLSVPGGSGSSPGPGPAHRPQSFGEL